VSKTLIKVLARGWQVYGKEPSTMPVQELTEAGGIPPPFSGTLRILTLNIPKDIEVKTLEEAGIAFHLISFLLGRN